MNTLTSYLHRITQKHNPDGIDYEELVPHFPETEGIPDSLYQICLRGKGERSESIIGSLPKGFQSNIRSLTDNNPTWSYHLIGDKEADDFILSNYGETIYSYYNRIDRQYGAAKADFLRYLILYTKGGVYLDLKSSIGVKLNDVITADDKYLVFYWDSTPDGQKHCLIPDNIPYGEYLTGIMASASGQLFSRMVIIQMLREIDNYSPYAAGVGWTGVQNVTGPTMYTKTIYQTILDNPQVSFRYVGLSTFDYHVSFFKDYIPGEYHKQVAINDYRQSVRPVVMNKSGLIQGINTLYLKLLGMHHSSIR